MKGAVILMVSIIYENVYCEPCFKYAPEVIPPDPTGNVRLIFVYLLKTNQYILINDPCSSTNTTFEYN